MIEISDSNAVEARRTQERAESLIREQEARESNRKYLQEKQKFESLLGKLRASSDETLKSLKMHSKKDPKVVQQELKERLKGLTQKHHALETQRNSVEQSHVLQQKTLERCELSKKRLEMLDELRRSMHIKDKAAAEAGKNEELVESLVSRTAASSESAREEDEKLEVASWRDTQEILANDAPLQDSAIANDFQDGRSSSEYLPQDSAAAPQHQPTEVQNFSRDEARKSFDTLADRVIELSSDLQGSEKSVEVRVTSPGGAPLNLTVSGGEGNAVSVTIRIESTAEYFSVLGRKREIARMLEQKGLSLKDLSVERSSVAKNGAAVWKEL